MATALVTRIPIALVAGCLGALALLACGSGASPRSARGVRLVPTPARIAATCRASPVLRAACPTEIPDARWDGRPGWAQARPLLIVHRTVFDVAAGAEHPGHPEEDRPPRFVHLVVVGGSSPLLALARPPRSARTVRVRNGLRRANRRSSIQLGARVWGGRRGALFLAASNASLLAHHLVFEWRSHGRTYAVSLHAWEPFTETVTTLRRVVASTDAGR
jgi:hypothetical protein